MHLDQAMDTALPPLGRALLCEACAVAGLTREDFENPPFVPENKYHKVVVGGTIGELRLKESQCCLCRLFLHAISMQAKSDSNPEMLADWSRKWDAEWLQNITEYDPETGDAENKYGSGLYPKVAGETPSNYGVQLIDEAQSGRLLRGRMIPRRMDVPRMTTWISMCRQQHGERCMGSELAIGDHPSSISGFLVIDVRAKCLVGLPGGAEFATLSYVWGRTNFPVTTKANFDIFTTEGIFDRVRLAKTVQDAINLTGQLGIQFLWVDSLCIVQDDVENKLTLIGVMDNIYGNSVLTIVAASGGHADAGLMGWSEERAPDHIVTVRVDEDLTLGVLPFFDAELMKSPYAKRGWT
jgi:hypothetical protein